MQTPARSRRFRNLFFPAALVAMLAPCVAVGELPSRLVLKSPRVVGEERSLSWTHPFAGWTYDVQSQETLGAPWSPAPGGSGLGAKAWSETRPAPDGGRWYRVVANPPPGSRGRLVSAAKVTSYSVGTLGFLFAFAGVPLVPQHDVDVYKLVYETVDPFGAPTLVSAELAVPTATTVPVPSWPLLAYAHGTALTRSDVPSTPNNTEGLAGVAMATSGYVSVLPDYLGLGDSALAHPYHHAASEATCMVDGLRAARLAAAAKGIPLTGQLFLCGYSQGGHAAMATLRELERHHAGEFAVTACAAMAGAYDLSGVSLDDALTDRQPPNPYYFAYLMKTLVDLYQIAPTFGSMLREPYATKVPPLFDGLHDGSEVNAAMPTVPKLAMKPEIVQALASDPNHPVRVALRDNDLTGFRPVARLRLYHCSGDLDVLPANSAVALSRYQALGATQVELLDPMPGADHGDCSQPSLLAAKAWFDSLRQ